MEKHIIKTIFILGVYLWLQNYICHGAPTETILSLPSLGISLPLVYIFIGLRLIIILFLPTFWSVILLNLFFDLYKNNAPDAFS